MTAGKERPSSATSNPPIPLDTDGEEDMMSFIRTVMESTLKPYAENMCELHTTVRDLSSSVRALQEKSDLTLLTQHSARIDDMQAEQDKLTKWAESTRQFLDGFIIEESSKIEQEAKINQQQAVTLQNLQETLATMRKDINKNTARHNVEETLTLIKSDVEELQKNGEDLRTKLVGHQDTEYGNFRTCVQLKNELQSVADNLKKIDNAQDIILKTVNSHKDLLDQEIMQNQNNKELEQGVLDAKFIALNGEITNKLNSLNSRFEVNQSQLKQYHEEFEQARDATNQSLLGMKDVLGRVPKETQANLDRIEADLKLMIYALLPVNLHDRLVTQDQQQKEILKDMKDVRRNLGDLEAMASKHVGEVAALQTATGVLPGRVRKLEEDAKFTSQRNQRLEETLGLEPMDPKAGLKKSACSGFLSEDQLQRKAWVAWKEAYKDAKQKNVASSIPNMQKMLEMQHNLIEKEKSKLHSTNDRVQSLEMDHTKLFEELQKLRKSLDLNAGHWKGMTRGLQAAKKTMHMELNALPPLTDLATARPESSFN